MPNWVMNKIMVGKKVYIDTIEKQYCIKREGKGYLDFDFNKIRKMPKELQIEFGSRSDAGIKLYMTKICPTAMYFGNKQDKVTKEEFSKMAKLVCHHSLNGDELILKKADVEEMKSQYADKLEDVVNLGKTQIDNIQKYGAMNWYEWSIKNWGTKWNASSYEKGEDGRSFFFETAWSPALPAILELSKQHPEMKFGYLYSDEEIGCRVGYALIHDGNVDFDGSFEDQSPDAYRLAFDLWGCGDMYRWDEKKETYIPIQEENEMCQY